MKRRLQAQRGPSKQSIMPPTLASPPWSPRSVNSIGIDIRSPRASSELLESVGRGRTQSLDMSNGRRRSSGDSFMSPQASLDSLNRSKELLQQSSTESIRFLYRHDSFVQEVQEERERVLKEARLLQDKQDEVERSLRRHLILKRHFGRFRHYYSKTNSLIMACNVFLNKTIALGWQHFQTWTVVLKNDNQLKRRALAALVSGNFRKAWSTWRAAAAALAVSSRRRRVAIQEWAGAGRRAAWLTWQEATVEWKMLMRAALAFITPAMRRGLLAWTRAVKEKAEKLMKLQSAAASMLDFDLRRALNSWVEQARAEVEKARRMRAAALEILGGKQRAAWRSWKELVDERRKLRHAAKGLTSPGLRRAMTTWIEMAIASKSNRDMLRRGMTSMRNVPVRKAYNTLRAMWEQLCWMRKALASMIYAQARRGLNAWMARHLALRNATRESRKLAIFAARLLKGGKVKYGFDVWRQVCRREREDSEAKRIFRMIFRSKMLKFLYRWIRNGSNWKIDLVCSRLAQTEADLHEVRRAAKVMEAEAIELRRMLGDHNEERKSNLRLEAEANHLRSSLAETRALNKQLEERASHFDTQYRRLWRATHDPTYISSIQEEKRLHTYTPGSRSRVDEMQHRREQEDAALADHEPKSDDFLNIKQIPGEPALRCSRSSVMAVSTFSSRQMRSPSASPTRARSPGLNGELQRFSELRQWREAQLTPSAHSPALVSTSVGGTVSSGRMRSR